MSTTIRPQGPRARRVGLVTGLIAAVALSLVPAAVSSSASAAAPYCGITWGSRTKQDNDHTTARITNLRAGRHECFDRLVVDLGVPISGLSGPQDEGFNVYYVDSFVDDPSGEPVPLAGGAFIEIIVNAAAHDDNFNPTYRPADRDRAVNVDGFSTFRQVAFRGTHEGLTQIGLGVRARLPFRVFVLDGPGGGSRVVIDVAHRWS